MESALVAVVCIALILFAALSIAQYTLSSTDTIATSWKEMESTSTDIARTDITWIDAEAKSAGTIVEATLSNDGKIKLEDFENWDVIIQYDDSGNNYLVKWLPYVASGLSDNQWTVEGIYRNATGNVTEVLESDIFNPAEEMIIRMQLNPALANNTTNQATFVTPNGISASATFTAIY